MFILSFIIGALLRPSTLKANTAFGPWEKGEFKGDEVEPKRVGGREVELERLSHRRDESKRK